MSGGVDSSVAAWLLRQQGHEVIGLFMRHGSPPLPQPPPCNLPTPNSQLPTPKQGCCTAADAADARRVAEKLGIPFYAVNFEEEFGRIVDYFVDEYTAGRTPNPCIVCNTWLKFGKLFEYADRVGARYVATGHYARIVPAGEGPCPALLRGRDAAKDQSYVLFGVDRRLLGRLCLPVGEHRKEEIRRIAGELGLPVAAKPDSQEICFVPDQDHARFIRQSRPGVDTSGEIVTTEGVVVGRHAGLEQFTVGQRKGLGVAFGERRYVVRLEPESRRVVVGTLDDLARRELVAAGANWLVDPPTQPFSCRVKIRYRSPAYPATVEPLWDKGAGSLFPGNGRGSREDDFGKKTPDPFISRFRVVFDAPCRGIAPGQAAVCYDGDRVLGGGWIE
jgi:tRNA-specific 2-thiouridylase